MIPLVITPEVMDNIRHVVSFAEAHTYSMDDLLDMINHRKTIPGDISDHVCNIPFGFRAVFTIEDQTVGRIRHLSISLDAPGRLPSVEATIMLMKCYGFISSVTECMIEVRQDRPESRKYIDIIELMK